ncbi:MAG: hypothetical protein H7A38_02950 [Chlamydiales bacterium]|nr:hypothetical protein [Chlamydiales bacterium]
MPAAAILGRGSGLDYDPTGIGDPSISDQVPLLAKSERVAKEALENSNTIIPEIIYCGTDLFLVPRMIGGLQDAIAGTPNPPGMSGLGLTSIFSVYTGVVATQRGYESYKKASEVKDSVGEVVGKVNMSRGPFEVLGGLTFTPFRALSIAAMYSSSKAVALAQVIFGTIGSAFFAVTYALLAIPSMISLHQNRKFDAKLTDAIDKHETRYAKAKMGIKTLMEEMTGTVEEKRAFLEKFAEDPKQWKGKDAEEVDPSLLTDKERRFLFEEATRLGAPDYTHVNELYDHFQVEFVKFKEKKEAQFGRKTGPETVAWVKRELAKPPQEQLLHQLEWGKGLDEAEEILGQVKNEMFKNRLLHLGIIVASLIGVAALIAGTIATGGGLGIAIAVAWVISAVGMLAIDGYFLYKALQQGEMNQKDKVAFFVMNVLMIAIAGAGIFFSGGLAPLIIGAVMLVLWIGVAGYAYYQSLQPIEEEVTQPVPHRGEAFIPFNNKTD